MNSKQYANQQEQAYKETLKNAGLNEGDYAGVYLSADRTEYTVTMTDGSTKIIPSGFEQKL
jgi:adenosylcobinamide amidohydrolase